MSTQERAKYVVTFGNRATLQTWEESFPTYTEAWVAFQTAYQGERPGVAALFFRCQP